MFYTKASDGLSGELAGDGFVNKGTEVEKEVFLAGEFHGLEDEESTGAGVVEGVVQGRDEIVQVVLIPDQEGGSVGLSVGVANAEYLALA